ncbi:DUF4752 family protein [Kosakonia sp. YIM B13605]|uniref:DUF4752 family protein n=1 Tax=unclassified Kosakonia TaxID=2632876 RepID=UPI0036B0BA7D
MDAFKNYGVIDWIMLAQLSLIWVYMAFKSGQWIVGIAIRKGCRWWNRKDDKALAMDSFYKAFNIASLEPGHTLTAKTESGLVIQVYRPKAVRDA